LLPTHLLPMDALERPEESSEQRLGTLLKRCRTRIDLERRSLGSFSRLASRIGKPPSQEEVSEAVGITRQWYAMMETNRPVRVSTRVLARIADVLMMDVSERAALFRLALPELHSSALRFPSTVDAFTSLRRLTRMLWAATTESEALTLALEYTATQFTADMLLACWRTSEGRWQFTGVGSGYDAERLERAIGAVRERSGHAAIDELLCYTVMTQPGEVSTTSERNFLGREGVSSAMASVRSQSGFVGRLIVVHAGAYSFSEFERQQLSTIADLTSVAMQTASASRTATIRAHRPSRSDALRA
jgi:transcriptional regulator with XRE-family HTH domain